MKLKAHFIDDEQKSVGLVTCSAEPTSVYNSIMVLLPSGGHGI